MARGKSSLISLAVVVLALTEVIASKCAPSNYLMEVSHEECIPRSIPTTTCSGLCRSHSEPTTDGTGEMVSVCKCCTPIHEGSRTIQVNLTCPGLAEGFKLFRVPKIKKCHCKECSSRGHLRK